MKNHITIDMESFIVFWCILPRHAMCLCHSIINNSSTKQLNGFCATVLGTQQNNSIVLMLWNIEKMVDEIQFIKVETTSKTRLNVVINCHVKGIYIFAKLSVTICPSQIISNCERVVFWVTKEWLLFTIERSPTLYFPPKRGRLFTKLTNEKTQLFWARPYSWRQQSENNCP